MKKVKRREDKDGRKWVRGLQSPSVVGKEEGTVEVAKEVVEDTKEKVLELMAEEVVEEMTRGKGGNDGGS